MSPSLYLAFDAPHRLLFHSTVEVRIGSGYSHHTNGEHLHVDDTLLALEVCVTISRIVVVEWNVGQSSPSMSLCFHGSLLAKWMTFRWERPFKLIFSEI